MSRVTTAFCHQTTTRSRRFDGHRHDNLPRTNAIAPSELKKIFFRYASLRKNEWIVSFDFHDNHRAGIESEKAWGLS
jgi:hypothetical protein